MNTDRHGYGNARRQTRIAGIITNCALGDWCKTNGWIFSFLADIFLLTRVLRRLRFLSGCFLGQRGIVFRKYKVAPRLGTNLVRRRLIERLCARYAGPCGTLEPTTET
jgi:hypothetical protein